jgi:hypothetical protein
MPLLRVTGNILRLFTIDRKGSVCKNGDGSHPSALGECREACNATIYWRRIKMRNTLIAIASAAALLPASTWAAGYPFVGKWNCEISEFTFTNQTYNNGQETYPILKIEMATQRMFHSDKRRYVSYRITLAKGYAFSLLNIKAKTMTWHSLASGDTFNCERMVDLK